MPPLAVPPAPAEPPLPALPALDEPASHLVDDRDVLDPDRADLHARHALHARPERLRADRVAQDRPRRIEQRLDIDAGGPAAAEEPDTDLAHRYPSTAVHTMERAGNPQCVGKCAVPSRSPYHGGGYVGGGKLTLALKD